MWEQRYINRCSILFTYFPYDRPSDKQLSSKRGETMLASMPWIGFLSFQLGHICVSRPTDFKIDWPTALQVCTYAAQMWLLLSWIRIYVQLSNITSRRQAFSLLTLSPTVTLHLSKGFRILPHHKSLFKIMSSKTSYCLHHLSLQWPQINTAW